MTSRYDNENIRFSANLARPSTSKGSILASDGNDFLLVAPTTDGQVLISDSAENSGVKWASATLALGFGVASAEINIPAEGSSIYFFREHDTVSLPAVPLLDCNCINISVNVTDIGYSDTPTNITGGTLDFTLGFIAADTTTTPGNFTTYSGGPHFQINGTDIDTAGENYSTFSSALSVSVTEGQQVCMRLTNNLTSSAAPVYRILNVFLLFRVTA